MKRIWVYTEKGEKYELSQDGCLSIRHPDLTERLANEGTTGERVMEGLRVWERDHGLNDPRLKYSPSQIKRIWAEEIRSNYGHGVTPYGKTNYQGKESDSN